MKIKRNIYTLIDANVNRAKEGLRVIEDVSRFLLADTKTTPALKAIRHCVDFAVKKISPDYIELIKNRSSENDIGRNSRNKSEFRRGGVSDILASNFKRVQESFRVLEEITKLISVPAAVIFKELRYKTYELEKELLLKI
ncbi:MAG: thiamine-phosphate pyrophosphorylase [Candidatus Goldiibacteriota bacterium]|jgi:thiamine-phosphate pyrophosphorylase